ncbi:MAG TPA: cupin domain-containing protein [Burkholderiaceae bacterium]|nr:cupin domain-containing protein [Burkholderiaceae bacterium]
MTNNVTAIFVDDLDALAATLTRAATRDGAEERPAAATAARMRARVWLRIGDERAASPGEQKPLRGLRNAPGFVDVAAGEGWAQVEGMPDGVLMKLLYDDGVTASWLGRVPPNCELPGHTHDDGPEECLVLNGELWLNGVRMVSGDYQLAAQGTAHDSIVSRSGCIVFVRSPSPATPRPRAGAARLIV